MRRPCLPGIQGPWGQYNDERRAAVTAGITRAVAEAEHGAWPHPELRVGVFTLEIPDGTWGEAGRVIRLADPGRHLGRGRTGDPPGRHLRARVAALARHGWRTARDRRTDTGRALARPGRETRAVGVERPSIRTRGQSI